MRSVKFTLALASLGGLVAFASCTLITDVDRSKIPNPDASTSGGGAAGDSGAGLAGSSDNVTAGDAGAAGSH